MTASRIVPARLRDVYARLSPGMRELVAFAIIGAINSVLNIVLFMIITATTTLGPGWASFFSAAITTVSSYLLNRRYAFTGADHTGARSFILFVLVNLTGIAIEGGVVAGAVGVFDIRTSLPLDAAKVAAIGVGTVFRYLAYRYLVFPTSTPKRDAEVLVHDAEEFARVVFPRSAVAAEGDKAA